MSEKNGKTVKLVHGKAGDVCCEVHRHGATVVSWKVDGREAIFVSSAAALDGSRPIRGGIPVCFPAFGAWAPGSQHGFARSSSRWAVEEGPRTDAATGDVSVTFVLADDEETRKIWDYRFK